MNPEFRKGKGPKIEEVSANQVSKALELTKESKKQNEERAEELIQKGGDIDVFQATKIELDSEDIGKFRRLRFGVLLLCVSL